MQVTDVAHEGGRYRVSAGIGGCAAPSTVTAIYEPRTSPLRVRLCALAVGPCAAHFEVAVALDLSEPLLAAGATEVEWVR